MIGRGTKNIPKEVIREGNWREIGSVMGGAVLLVLLFNCAACWYLERFTPNAGYLLIRAKWHLLATLKNPVDLLILGDSSGNQGVDPEVLEDSLGLTSVNLCTIGDALVLDDAWLLEEYLSRFGSPKAGVLMVHGYDMWSRDINMSVLSKVPGNWWRQPPAMSLGMKDRVRLYLNRYVPLYTENVSLSWLLQHPWKAFQAGLNLRSDGFMVESTGDAAQVRRDADVHSQFVRQAPPVMSAPNRQALQQILSLADQYQFDLFLANGPLYEELPHDSAFRGYFQSLQDALRLVGAASSRVHYLAEQPVTFPAEQMQSADHVAYSAAKAYSCVLAQGIRAIRQEPPPR